MSTPEDLITCLTGATNLSDLVGTPGYQDNSDGTYSPGGSDDIDTRAASNPYTPGTAGDWDLTVPANVADALDELAQRPGSTSDNTAVDLAAATAALPATADNGDVHCWFHPDGIDCGFASWIWSNGTWKQLGFHDHVQPDGAFNAGGNQTTVPTNNTFVPVNFAGSVPYSNQINVVDIQTIEVEKAGNYEIRGVIAMDAGTPAIALAGYIMRNGAVLDQIGSFFRDTVPPNLGVNPTIVGSTNRRLDAGDEIQLALFASSGFGITDVTVVSANLRIARLNRLGP